MDPLESVRALIEAHCIRLAIGYHRNYNVIFANLFDSEKSIVFHYLVLFLEWGSFSEWRCLPLSCFQREYRVYHSTNPRIVPMGFDLCPQLNKFDLAFSMRNY